MSAPQDEVAGDFMSRRGYDLAPIEVSRVDGQHCWYYLYELPEGDLELEVSWDPVNGWGAAVSTFARVEEDEG